MISRLAFQALLLIAAAVVAHAQSRVDVSVDDLNAKYRLIGKLGKPLGEPVKVEGIAVDRNTKDAGTDLVVQRIDGRATQTELRIDLEPFFEKFGEPRGKMHLPEIKLGTTYEFEGFERGWYHSPVPAAAMKQSGSIGMLPPRFYTGLSVYKGRSIPTIHFTPAEFLDRDALLDGRAVSKNGKSFISRDNWRVLVTDDRAWPGEVEGKLVEGRGIVRATDAKDEYRLENASATLVRLEDQVGREVKLRGTAFCEAGSFWWFEYRDTKLYVENMEKLPGWTGENRWRPMVIRGTLESAKLPRIDEVTHKSNPAVVECYIVRTPKWEPCDPLLAPERLPISE